MKPIAALVIILSAAYFLPALAQAPKINETVDSNFQFSIRCSKGPRVAVFAGIMTVWYDLVYLKWEADTLTRQVYSIASDSPHIWRSNEEPLIYTDKNLGGKSSISVERVESKFEKNVINRVSITLDASGVDQDLQALIGDYITHGQWEIFKDSDSLSGSLKETTSSYYKGKLSKTTNSHWNECRLMTPSGSDSML